MMVGGYSPLVIVLLPASWSSDGDGIKNCKTLAAPPKGWCWKNPLTFPDYDFPSINHFLGDAGFLLMPCLQTKSCKNIGVHIESRPIVRDIGPQDD